MLECSDNSAFSREGDIGKFEKYMRVHLSDELIATLLPPLRKETLDYYDDVVRRMACRITRAGWKTFKVSGKLKRETIHFRLGTCNELTVDAARAMAIDAIELMDKGIHAKRMRKLHAIVFAIES